MVSKGKKRKFCLLSYRKELQLGFLSAVEQNTNIEVVSQFLQVYVNRLPSQGKFFSKYEKPVVL